MSDQNEYQDERTVDRFAHVSLDRGAYPDDFIVSLNGYITGGSGRCREALESLGVTISAHPSPTPAADADRVRKSHEQAVRLRQLKHRLLQRKATLGDMDDLVEVIHFLEMPAVSSFATQEAK